MLGKMLPGKSALDQIVIQIFQDIAQVTERHGTHAVQDLLVALFGHNALLRVALTMAKAEQFFKHIFQVQLAAPAKAFGKRQGNSIAIVHMSKGISIHGIFHMAADHAGKAVQRQHGTLAGTAAGDNIIRCAGIQQHRCQNAVLHIGQLGGIIGCVHTIVDNLMAHRLHNLAQDGFDQGVLGGLAVFIDQCNFHGLISPVYCILEGSRVVCSGNPIYHITSSRKYLVFTV